MIRLEKVTKTFDDVLAVDNVTFDVPEGEICVLLGPSGCGKTTTMRMINRLIELSSGKISIGGKNIMDVSPIELRRSIGYVIQQIGLFPNKTVLDNICAVPDLLGVDRKESRKRALDLMEMVALDPKIFAKRYPKELSGGQAQRVGVIRALAADPPVLLMDEPFGAIDPINRAVIQDEFLKLQQEVRKTVIFVSHDIDEAVKMADRIAIFRAGKLVQYDTPDDILAHPKDNFIADFVGADRTLKRLQLVPVLRAMQDNPPRVRKDTPLAEAKAVLENHDHKVMIVTGPNGRVRGQLRAGSITSTKGIVEDVYEAAPATIHVDANLRDAVAMMFSHDQTWLPCVDDDGFYRGFLTQRSITHLLGATYRDD